MAYSNTRTKGSFVRGFESLSPEIGSSIWNQVTIHDDGQKFGGYGGTRFFGIGGQGAGKTTLLSKIARSTFYIDGMSKREYFAALNDCDDPMDLGTDLQKIHPETNLWRGRSYDVWLALHPYYFKKYYPEELMRPLRVHTFADKNLKFHQEDAKTGEITEIPNLDVCYYKSVSELCHNLVEGGHNVIYPPKIHFMSASLKDSLNTKRSARPKTKSYLNTDENYLVERDVFMFEIFEYIYHQSLFGKKRGFYTALMDEAHNLFEANSPDIYFWIIAYMVDLIIDTRKNNISLAAMSHALNLIDYRILERASHFGWMKGAKPSGNYSMLDTRLTKKLQQGQLVPESVMDGKIGGVTFTRLPDMPSLVVEDLAGRKDLLSEISKDEYIGVTAEG